MKELTFKEVEEKQYQLELKRWKESNKHIIEQAKKKGYKTKEEIQLYFKTLSEINL